MNVFFSKKPPIYFITNEGTAQTVYKFFTTAWIAFRSQTEAESEMNRCAGLAGGFFRW